MNYNLNSGYGQMLAMQIAASVGPNFGNVLVVIEDSDNSTIIDMVKESMVPDPNGRVRFFSEDSKNAELYLQETKVYDNASGRFLYDVAGMYVSLERTDMTIELSDATLEKESTVESE